jgi:hypothetical protein
MSKDLMEILNKIHERLELIETVMNLQNPMVISKARQNTKPQERMIVEEIN